MGSQMPAGSQAVSSQFLESILAVCFRTGPAGQGEQPDTGSPAAMVTGPDEMDLVGSLTEVAIKVTVPPLGTVPGAW